jgi:hypothetical protein
VPHEKLPPDDRRFFITLRNRGREQHGSASAYRLGYLCKALKKRYPDVSMTPRHVVPLQIKCASGVLAIVEDIPRRN